MTHRNRLIARWLVGIAATVLAGGVLAFLVSIASTVVENKGEQARQSGQTQAQIQALTSQVAELRQELAGVPALTSRVNKLEAQTTHQARAPTARSGARRALAAAVVASPWGRATQAETMAAAAAAASLSSRTHLRGMP